MEVLLLVALAIYAEVLFLRWINRSIAEREAREQKQKTSMEAASASQPCSCVPNIIEPTPIDNTPHSVQLARRRFLIDDKPRQVFAGEVHYFRLHPGDWADRLQKLKDAGFDTCATYIPWIWHELPDGTIDVTGVTHPQRNLTAFLDLCHSMGLKVLARPGPFIMAELKNEGIPYRLYRDPTNLRPTTWESKPVTTSTLDYLAPEFLTAVRGWYDTVMPVLAERLAPKGGPVIAVQLDNEIGMLSWVSNSPDLTDNVCEDMRTWARARYGDLDASARMGADAKDAKDWARALRKPLGAALPLHHDLGLYMRDRFRRYVHTLREMAEANGVKDVPFVINVHGTGGGRGRTFPIGISQLYESYQRQPQMTSGSDIYLGDLTTANLPDLYLINAYMGAVHDDDQPTMSLEFEAGDANYGDDFSSLQSPRGVDLKTRLCVAQGNRLLNYYLFAGGENPPMECGDGLDRIAITGQRHGFAAPVGPEGQLNPTYASTQNVVRTLRAIEPLVADGQEEFDGFAVGFVPDHYLTEYRYPGSWARGEQIADMERFRGAGSREVLIRNLLMAGFSFPAVNLQAGVPDVPCIVMTTGKTLGADVQNNLARYVEEGGKLLLFGLLPEVDHDGNRCTVLADALGLKNTGVVNDGMGPNGLYWASVDAVGWAAPRAEVRVGYAQLLEPVDEREFEPFLLEAGTKKACAAQVSAGKGTAIVFGTEYRSDFDLFRDIMARLGVQPRFQIVSDHPGVMVTSTVTSDGQKLLHLINVADYKVTLSLAYKGTPLFNHLEVNGQSGLILPMRVYINNGIIVQSTAEIAAVSNDGFTVFSRGEDVVIIETDKQVETTNGWVLRDGDRVVVEIPQFKPREEDFVRITLS